ncbi:ABC transporter permease [Bifidobacterium tsurumiense]|uniref:Osmoprotectant (Glycine betaine/carnitine/choline/L-proline) ABC transporter,inner membrane subunit n=1 Tax=Bifidobacterium tsurumiense TaxID=356829 RepID=A0A087ECI3_9BIFI|nr:ABC transporter permease [Bifidobacterium tsurumiense]KFJ05484.1 osmoprotectant (glycine betaine/carnitine/choline/L-proline) ABC transporter,inner membrane subunit [Bifidobacterium tsurumiense]
MTLINSAWQWFINPANWSGSGSIPLRIGQHFLVSLVAVLIAAIIAIPTGVAIGHTGRGKSVIAGITGAMRAIPTLGLLTLFGLLIGIGIGAPLLALIVLAIPSLLAGAYSGVESVDTTSIQAARAIGFTTWGIVSRVELPLASPLIVGGIRSAVLQVIATSTLAAYTADMGLGRYIFAGLKTRDYGQMLGGAILVTVMALLAEILFAWLQRYADNQAHPRSE